MTEERIKQIVRNELDVARGWELGYKMDYLTIGAPELQHEYIFWQGAVYALGDLICALWGVDTYVEWLEEVENKDGV